MSLYYRDMWNYENNRKRTKSERFWSAVGYMFIGFVMVVFGAGLYFLGTLFFALVS